MPVVIGQLKEFSTKDNNIVNEVGHVHQLILLPRCWKRTFYSLKDGEILAQAISVDDWVDGLLSWQKHTYPTFGLDQTQLGVSTMANALQGLFLHLGPMISGCDS